MGFTFHTSKTKFESEMGGEGLVREALAAYFLSAPSPEKQTPKEQVRFKRALRRMAEIEVVSLLQSAAIRRPLRYGDVNALLSVILEASFRRLQENGMILEYSTPDKSICAATEPRLLVTALIRLLRAAAAVNPNYIYAAVKLHKNSISVVVKGENVIKDTQAMSLVRSAARLHKGGVAVSGGTVAFSLRCDLSGSIGLFAAPALNDLLNNPISPVNIGFA